MWLLSPFTAFKPPDDLENDAPATEVGAVAEGPGSLDVADDVEILLQVEIARLADEFQGTFSAESIDRLARDSLDEVRRTSARHFLAELAGRFTRERLKARAKVEDVTGSHDFDVLFVCGRNAARSQMAAAFAQHLGQGRLSAHSAGRTQQVKSIQQSSP